MRYVVLSAFALLAGCASIVSKSDYPVTFNTNPSGADIEITDRSGKVIFEGKSPAHLTLNASTGFFRGARYSVSASHNGSAPVVRDMTAGLDGWYIANILFGGLIGMLIVDPATGAMYKLENEFIVNLPRSTAESGDLTITIASIDAIPADIRHHLVPVDLDEAVAR